MTDLVLEPEVLAALRDELVAVSERTLAAVTAEVPEYARSLDASMGATVQTAVQMALAGFLRLAAEGTRDDTSTTMQAALQGAYALGRGEARSGRTVDALLAAYRVGARVSWREWSTVAVAHGLPAAPLARFAELVFAYIDELSAASLAGHTDELATSGRVREQYLERLGRDLLDGLAPEQLTSAAARADWPVPRTLTAVLLPDAHLRGGLALLPQRTLALSADVVELDGWAVALVPDADRSRAALTGALRGRAAVVGPTRPWTAARSSYTRAVRGLELHVPGQLLDTEQHLTSLVLTADGEALADLRAQALLPLAGVRPATAERLAETLRSWLLHQGRREDVAAHLVVHPQTVRYRMTQLRELYGDRLTDPEQVLALVVALG